MILRAASLTSLALLTLLTAATACTSSDTPEGPGQTPDKVLPTVERSSLARETPHVVTADQQKLAAGNTAFAAQLYQRYAAAPDTNLVLSPHSISLALAMTYAGAAGSTKTEIENTLHFALKDATHPAMNWLDAQLATRGANAHGQNGKPFRLAVNNALFGQKSYAFQTPFLDALAKNYGAGMATVDFLHDSEGARQSINKLGERQNRVAHQRAPCRGTVGELTRLVLVNTIYMNAGWQLPFNPANNGTFHTKSGDVQAKMMGMTASWSYASSSLGQSVDLPLEDPNLAMTLVLPQTDMAGFDGAVDGATLDALVSSSKSTRVSVTLPTFKLEPESKSLKNDLVALGMKTAFTRDADFSGITATEPTHLDDVVHKAFIEVSETGVEAAAATAVLSAGSGAAPVDPPKVVSFDRPFFYGIRDVTTGAWLFVGRVANPTL